MTGPNQLDRLREDVSATEADLLAVPEGTRTERGLGYNIRVGIHYLEAWLRGLGCVPLYNLMEDAATAEISRVQVWQWLRHGARARRRNAGHASSWSSALLDEELRVIENEVGAARFKDGRYARGQRAVPRPGDCPRLRGIPDHPGVRIA